MKTTELTPKKFAPRSTEFVVEQRVAKVEELLRAKPIHKHQLLKKIRDRYNISRASAEMLVARARDRIVLSLQQSRTEHRCESWNLYQSIITSPTSTNMEKLRAQEQCDLLLGARAPAQSQLSIDAHLSAAPSEEPSFDEVSKHLDTDTLGKILHAVREAKKAKGIPPLENQSPTAPTRYAGLLPNSKYPLASITEAEVIADDR